MIPRILVHRRGVQAPSIHLPESEGEDVLEPQSNHKRRMSERLHLVNFQRQPEGQRCYLNHQADYDQRPSRAPDRSSQVLSIAQEQRHSNECHQFHGTRNIAIAPGKVAAPVGVSGVKGDIRQQQENRGRPISAHLWGHALPQPCQEENCQHEKRIEEKNRFLRLE